MPRPPIHANRCQHERSPYRTVKFGVSEASVSSRIRQGPQGGGAAILGAHYDHH